MCTKRTALSTLFRCWPPGPEPLSVCTSTSLSRGSEPDVVEFDTLVGLEPGTDTQKGDPIQATAQHFTGFRRDSGQPRPTQRIGH